MSVTQINLWACDLCGTSVALSERVNVYDDPVVIPPNGWTWELAVPIQHRRNAAIDVCDACPACQANPDWSNYREESR